MKIGYTQVICCLFLLKLTGSHLKMDGVKTIVSFWGPAYFQRLYIYSFVGCIYGGVSCWSAKDMYIIVYI